MGVSSLSFLLVVHGAQGGCAAWGVCGVGLSNGEGTVVDTRWLGVVI